MDKQLIKGYLAMWFTILVWGSANISVKIVLDAFSPVDVLFLRVLLGVVTLYFIAPKLFPFQGFRRELQFMFAGFFGVFLYYALQIFAIHLTYVSNVGLIGMTAPLFIALIGGIFYGEWHVFNRYFVCSFLMAMAGIYSISFQNANLEINPWGDFLMVIGCIAWAGYTVVVKKIDGYGYPMLLWTRRILLYALLFIGMLMCYLGDFPNFCALGDLYCLGHIIFVGVFATALCYAAWNYAVVSFGAVKTAVYSYLTPIVNLIVAMLVLHEKFTVSTGLGMALIIGGVLLSHKKMA